MPTHAAGLRVDLIAVGCPGWWSCWTWWYAATGSGWTRATELLNRLLLGLVHAQTD